MNLHRFCFLPRASYKSHLPVPPTLSQLFSPSSVLRPPRESAHCHSTAEPVPISTPLCSFNPLPNCIPKWICFDGFTSFYNFQVMYPGFAFPTLNVEKVPPSPLNPSCALLTFRGVCRGFLLFSLYRVFFSFSFFFLHWLNFHTAINHPVCSKRQVWHKIWRSIPREMKNEELDEIQGRLYPTYTQRHLL